MKTFKFSLVLRTRENTDVFITLDDNIYGIHGKRVNIRYLPLFYLKTLTSIATTMISPLHRPLFVRIFCHSGNIINIDSFF